MPGQRGTIARLVRVLGFDGNPLRRASDRAEAWIRVVLLTVFLIVGPLSALRAGHWAYHAGTAARTHRVTVTVPQLILPPSDLARSHGGSQASAGTRSEGAEASSRSGEVVTMVMTLGLMALAFLVVLRITLALLLRRRLAAWETAWSRVGPRWTTGRWP